MQVQESGTATIHKRAPWNGDKLTEAKPPLLIASELFPFLSRRDAKPTRLD
jgi:hypothetical protein